MDSGKKLIANKKTIKLGDPLDVQFESYHVENYTEKIVFKIAWEGESLDETDRSGFIL